MKNCYFIVSLLYLSNIISKMLCLTAVFKVCLPIFEKSQTFKMAKRAVKIGQVYMDIILSFLAKPVDKHGITPVHITYSRLEVYISVSHISWMFHQL